MRFEIYRINFIKKQFRGYYMGNKETAGSVGGSLDPFQNAELAALLKALRKPKPGDPPIDYGKHLGDKQLTQIAAIKLQKDIDLEKQATELKKQVFEHQLAKEKAATEIKEQALTMMKQNL
jgi:hypothetical protein